MASGYIAYILPRYYTKFRFTAFLISKIHGTNTVVCFAIFKTYMLQFALVLSNIGSKNAPIDDGLLQ